MQDFHRYYQLLGLSPAATAEEVKEAYHRLARQYHPDLNPGNKAAEEKFKSINEAYEVLTEVIEQIQNQPTVAQSKPPEYGSAADFCDRAAKKVSTGNYAAAISHYSRALQIDSKNAQTYSQRGFAYYQLGAYKEAFKDYSQALKLNPQLAEAYYNRGIARRKLGYPQGAIQDFNQALRFNTNDAQAYRNRGVTRADLGDSKTAISDLQTAAKLFSDQGKIASFQATLDLLTNVQRVRAVAIRKKAAIALAVISSIVVLALLLF